VRDPGERLLDMLEAIERIDRYAEKGREDFEKDELIQNWFVRHLCSGNSPPRPPSSTRPSGPT
jgi:uncharacterized protein with HEPN domain